MKIIICFFILFVSCNPHGKFDKEKWCKKDDMVYMYRKSILHDLTTNYHLIGQSYKQLIGLLGQPNYYYHNGKITIYYEIETDYGFDIDPVYGKTLQIRLTKDSIVEAFSVEEWHK